MQPFQLTSQNKISSGPPGSDSYTNNNKSVEDFGQLFGRLVVILRLNVSQEANHSTTPPHCKHTRPSTFGFQYRKLTFCDCAFEYDSNY